MIEQTAKRQAERVLAAIGRALREDPPRVLAVNPEISYGVEPDPQTRLPKKSGVVTYSISATIEERVEPRPAPAAAAVEPDGYLFEPEDVAQLRTIAQRLGDERPLTHDQRRDLMNALCVVVGRAHEYSE